MKQLLPSDSCCAQLQNMSATDLSAAKIGAQPRERDVKREEGLY